MIHELRTRRALAALALLAGVGCEDVADAGKPTAVELSSDRTTAAVAEPIEFRYEAQGQNLAGLVIDYADGSRDSIPGFGAQTAAGTVTHAFEAAGTFDVTAALLDFSGETADDTVVVMITAPAQDH
ncbi:MAG: hypothetical protein KY466_02215 [Gemmatimonadetes bacterium]|nr:hypothetical protein [Gemmatimonadota bacterium]